jgi:MFS family permease
LSDDVQTHASAAPSGKAVGLTKGILFVALVVFAMGQTILFALLGPVARDIGFAEWQVGAIISASAVAFVLVSPIWGGLADRWGRKNVIVGCLLAYALTTLVFAGLLQVSLAGTIGAAAAFASLMATRVLYAFTAGGIQPAAVALMADLTDETGRSAGVALVGAGFGLGTVLGPALAAGLVNYGVLTPLFLAAGLALTISVLAAWVLREPRQLSSIDADAPTASVNLATIAPHLMLMFATYVAIATLQQTTAFYIQDFTQTTTQGAARLSGIAFMALALAMLLVQGGVVQWLKPSPAQMLWSGLPLASLGIIVYALAPTFDWIVAAFVLMGAGFGLVQPGISALVSLATGSTAQGGAAGFVQAAMAGGFVVGPLAGTLVYAVSPRAPLLLALAILVVCLILLIALSARTATKAAPASAE